MDVIDHSKFAEYGARRVKMLFKFMIEYVILERNVESLLLLAHWRANRRSGDTRSIAI
jgi:hypothetical protein